MRDDASDRRLSRRTVLGAGGAAGLVALAGCLGEVPSGSPASDPDEADGPDGGPPTADRSLPEDYAADELLEASLDGGPGEDGIPSIDEPTFAGADDGPSVLNDGDPVFGVELNDEAKAYPQYVLVWHEIVNDVVGEEPVAITYCPLTGTAQGFYRGDVEFGVSGELINSNLVMFDRTSDSWWPQLLARGIDGPYEGAYLEEFRVVWTTWERWRDRHPDTVVLTEETGHIRNYGEDPYGAYNPTVGYYAEDDDRTLFPPLASDDRYPPKTVVIGARTDDGAVAVPKDHLREAGVVEGTVGDVPYVSVFDDRLATGYVYRNPEDVSVERDDGAATTVRIDGKTHDPDELPLERVISFDAMWFAWYGYYPSTTVHE